MGALNPLFLLAGLTVAVPIFLHLFHRQQAQRRVFPALRYLERTEREHARQIRFRQLLLLVLRVAVLVLVVAAGARLFFQGRGAAHPPTAVAVVLDNSMSSGRVVGAERVLDRLRARALESVDATSPDDRIWLLAAGEPWQPAEPLTPAEARARIRETPPSAARGDLTATLERAAGLVRASPLEAREIHLLSDLQASAFDPERPAPAGTVPVVAWREPPPARPNRSLVATTVGAGLAPLQGQRTTLAVRAGRSGPGDTAVVPVRVLVDDRIRGAGTVPAGAEATIPLPPAPAGWVRGWVESDPDDLRADDRRAFAFRSRPAPTVAVLGDVGTFVENAVSVLEDAGRVRRSGSAQAHLLIAGGGEGVEGAAAGSSVLVLPPADAGLLPGLNRRLAAAGIGWRYARGREAEGTAVLQGPRLPEALDGAEVRRWYRLGSDVAGDAAPDVLARIAGDPWLVEGTSASGVRYLLLASSLDPESGTLPVTTAMMRFVDWVTGAWSGAGAGPGGSAAGEPLPAPSAATHVRTPSGAVLELDGTRTVPATAEAGFYTFLAADTVVEVAAVNPPAAESDLTPLAEDDVARLIGPGTHLVDDAGDWPDEVFRDRQGPELWRPLLALGLLLLLAESSLAASRRAARAAAGPVSAPGRLAPEGHAAD